MGNTVEKSSGSSDFSKAYENKLYKTKRSEQQAKNKEVSTYNTEDFKDWFNRKQSSWSKSVSDGYEKDKFSDDEMSTVLKKMKNAGKQYKKYMSDGSLSDDEKKSLVRSANRTTASIYANRNDDELKETSETEEEETDTSDTEDTTTDNNTGGTGDTDTDNGSGDGGTDDTDGTSNTANNIGLPGGVRITGTEDIEGTDITVGEGTDNEHDLPIRKEVSLNHGFKPRDAQILKDNVGNDWNNLQNLVAKSEDEGLTDEEKDVMSELEKRVAKGDDLLRADAEWDKSNGEQYVEGKQRHFGTHDRLSEAGVSAIDIVA